MLHILVIASFLSVACGTQYAYFGNNLVEFDDIPSNSISLPYPYKESKVINIDQRPVNYGVGVRTAVVSSSPTIVETQEVSLSPFRLICSLATCVMGYAKKMFMYVITSIPALIFGCFSSLGLCNFRSLCKFFNIDPVSYVNEMTSFVTADRFKRATEFVETAIKKYTELQKN